MLSIKVQHISENISYMIFKKLFSEGGFNLYIKSTSCNDVTLGRAYTAKAVGLGGGRLNVIQEIDFVHPLHPRQRGTIESTNSCFLLYSSTFAKTLLK
jgi:hypothetical protein